MADFEEMLAWVHCGPGYRHTAALTEPRVPIGGCWSPAGTSEVKELPSFPDALVEWATKEFENAKPVRSLRDTLEAEHNLQAARRPASSRNEGDARSLKAGAKPSRRGEGGSTAGHNGPRGLTRSPLLEPAEGLRGRVVIDAEMFADASNRSPSLVHHRRLGRDRLLDRILGRSPKLNYNRDLSEGSQPL